MWPLERKRDLLPVSVELRQLYPAAEDSCPLLSENPDPSEPAAGVSAVTQTVI